MPHDIDAHKPLAITFIPLPPSAWDELYARLQTRLMKHIEEQMMLPKHLLFPGNHTIIEVPPCQQDMNYSSTTGSLVQLVNSRTGG